MGLCKSLFLQNLDLNVKDIIESNREHVILKINEKQTSLYFYHHDIAYSCYRLLTDMKSNDHVKIYVYQHVIYGIQYHDHLYQSNDIIIFK